LAVPFGEHVEANTAVQSKLRDFTLNVFGARIGGFLGKDKAISLITMNSSDIH
jgi:hypothetical protein